MDGAGLAEGTFFAGKGAGAGVSVLAAGTSFAGFSFPVAAAGSTETVEAASGLASASFAGASGSTISVFVMAGFSPAKCRRI